MDDETRSIMEAQSERLYGETKAILARLKPLTEHLVGKLMEAGEMGLEDALLEIRNFEGSRVALSQQQSALLQPRGERGRHPVTSV